SMAQEGAIRELADRPVQGGGDPADHPDRYGHGVVPRLEPVQVALASVQLEFREPVRDQCAFIAVVHGIDVRPCARGLPDREVLSEEPGDRSQVDLPGDPGRVETPDGTGGGASRPRPSPRQEGPRWRMT